MAMHVRTEGDKSVFSSEKQYGVFWRTLKTLGKWCLLYTVATLSGVFCPGWQNGVAINAWWCLLSGSHHPLNTPLQILIFCRFLNSISIFAGECLFNRSGWEDPSFGLL